MGYGRVYSYIAIIERSILPFWVGVPQYTCVALPTAPPPLTFHRLDPFHLLPLPLLLQEPLVLAPLLRQQDQPVQIPVLPLLRLGDGLQRLLSAKRENRTLSPVPLRGICRDI